ncbi:TIGR02530 family flagellar biosynthesis protein [Bacillus tianshenii]|nr:TIGR02530 family flagellar biosynthesis protein [Bacillus tianshenii]
MDHRINHLQQPLPTIRRTKQEPTKQQATVSFKEQLTKTIEQNDTLKVSKHAKQRLAERNITINEAQWNKISERVSEAKRKGVRDALVLTADSALVVSAKNHTVITAMDRQEAASQIFTNINGTILMDKE